MQLADDVERESNALCSRDVVAITCTRRSQRSLEIALGSARRSPSLLPCAGALMKASYV
jgi:hypothetical protein